MDMEYSGYSTQIISNERVEQIAPKEYKALFYMVEFLVDNSYSGYSIALFDNEDNADLIELTEILYAKVKEVTGLEITWNYHDQEEQGSRYDEVDGFFFEVCNGTIPNPKLTKETHKLLEWVSYVSYG